MTANLDYMDEVQKKNAASTKTTVAEVTKEKNAYEQLLETIEKHLPEKFNRYFEPFIGGGALLMKLQPKIAFINDS